MAPLPRLPACMSTPSVPCTPCAESRMPPRGPPACADARHTPNHSWHPICMVSAPVPAVELAASGTATACAVEHNPSQSHSRALLGRTVQSNLRHQGGGRMAEYPETIVNVDDDTTHRSVVS